VQKVPKVGNIHSDSDMAEKILRCRSVATVSKKLGDSIVTNVSESVDTDCVQITGQGAGNDVVGDTTIKYLGDLSQQIKMPAIQWQEMLDSLKEVIETEISKQREIQTAVLEAKLNTVSESLDAKLNSACEKLNQIGE
jgi:hypothetical protein